MPQKIYEIGFPFVILIISLLYLSSGMKEVRFHPDEAGKISDSYYYHLFFEKGDFSNPDWHQDFYARTNPPVAKYIMGLGLSLQGYHIQSLELQQKFETYWDKPAILKQYVPPSLLHSARAVSVTFGLLCCLVVYLIGRLLGGVFLGLLSAFILLFHPLFKTYCQLALTDSILLFFMTSILLPCSWYLRHIVSSINDDNTVLKRRLTFWPIIIASLFPGLNIALAAGTKLNGALAAFLFLLAVLACTLSIAVLKRTTKNEGQKKLLSLYLLSSIFSALLSIVVFIAINPYLHSDPIHKMFHILSIYRDWMIKQMLDPGELLISLPQKLAAAAYFHFIQSDLPLQVWQNSFTISPRFALFFIGLGIIVAKAIRQLKKGFIPIWEYLVLLWLFVYGIGIIAWVPLTWPRYFLPLSPVISLFIAIGVAGIVQSIWQVMLKTTIIKEAFQTSSIGFFPPLFRNDILLVCILTVCVLVLYNNRLISNFGLVPPAVFSEMSHDRLRNLYNKAINNKPDDPSGLFNMADLMLIDNRPSKAVSLYQAGMEIARKRNVRSLHKIRLATIEYKLSQALILSGNYTDAIIVLDKHLSSLKEIRDSLKTSDTKVSEEFNRIIRDRKNLLRKLKDGTTR